MSYLLCIAPPTMEKQYRYLSSTSSMQDNTENTKYIIITPETLYKANNTSFWHVINIILRMKIGRSSSFRILICLEYQWNLFLLITYWRKATLPNVDAKEHYKCELLNCCFYPKHFDQIHHNTRWKVFGRNVSRIKKKIGIWLLCGSISLLFTGLVHLLTFCRLWTLEDLL